MRTDELGRLLALARGRHTVVELGTGTAWTAIALALADPKRRVVSYDPIARGERQRYLHLAGASVSERIELLELPGESGPQPGAAAPELVFIDSSHEREESSPPSRPGATASRRARSWRSTTTASRSTPA